MTCDARTISINSSQAHIYIYMCVCMYVYLPISRQSRFTRLGRVIHNIAGMKDHSSEVLGNSITKISPCWRFHAGCTVPSTIAAPNAPGHKFEKNGSFGLGNSSSKGPDISGW